MEGPYFNLSRRNMERSWSGTSSGASLQSSCNSHMSTDTSFSSSDSDGDPSLARRTELFCDILAYLARRQANVEDRGGDGEGDDDIPYVSRTQSASSSDDDGDPLFPRRAETTVDLDAYFAARRQTAVADGRVEGQSERSIFCATQTQSGSSSNDEGVRLFPRRVQTIHDFDAYFARRQTSVGGGSGDGDGGDYISSAAQTPSDRSSDVAVDSRRTERMHDLYENFARRQTYVADRSDGDEADEGDGETLDNALMRDHVGSDDDGIPSDPRRAESMPVFHAIFVVRQAHVVESTGGGEGHRDMFDALHGPLSTGSAPKDAVSAPASMSRRPARSGNGDDAADHSTRPRSWTGGFPLRGLSFGGNHSISSGAAREFMISDEQVVREQTIGEAAALATSVHADIAHGGFPARVTDVPGGARRESIIAMARARRRQL
eukprot:TRINITY_DN8592_c0_g2_i1.p1 TRINITY_DN8592_c0_g2~~TRINITY_DN8592_c0_g2_i1.p1  ORF type:complete len:443 (-),score=52.07 TRINITY_DN8592_c0_g2_i1:410-1711(-)